MSMLNRLHRAKADKPPRILIYGQPGIGKTTFASEFPNPIFLQVEDGTPAGAELASFGLLKSYREVMQAIGELYDNAESLDFQTVVLDSVTAMQRLIFTETCERGDEHGNRKTSIEDFGYGKGYVNAQRIWQELIEALDLLRDDKNMAIVLVAHSTIERFDDPESVSYDRYAIDLHKKSVGAIEQNMDAILLLKNKVSIDKEKGGFNKDRAIAKGGATVWVSLNPKPAYVAKNRYEIDDFIYQKGGGFAQLATKIAWVPTAQAPTDDAADAA